MKKVLITIRSSQSDNGENQSIEFMTEGVLRKTDENYILSYNDTQIFGESEKSGVKTRVTAYGEKKVIIERSGDLSSKLIIENGTRTSCLYSIPQGDLTLSIYGKSIKNGFTDSGGVLKMVYTIDANMQYLNENTIEIAVREV